MTAATKKKPTTARRKKTLAPVLVTMVLDRSGSMDVCRSETIEAFNSYVEQLRKDAGDTFVTLRQFDDQHDVLYRAVAVKDVPTLTHADYVPRASTALNDAIALAISDASTAEVPEGTKRLVVVITDGHENRSYEHSPASIKRLVSEHERDGWTFVFLQGNLDLQAAQDVAAGYGVSAGNVAAYSNHVPGSTSAVMASMGAVTRSVSLSAAGASLNAAFATSGVGQDYHDPDKATKAPSR